MASSLFNAFGNRQPQNNPFANMNQFISQFNQFRQNFNGNPQQAVQQMLNSGQISQEQFNNAANMANQIMQFIGKR